VPQENPPPNNMWALCDGSTLQISDYTQLFSLLGTTYGGDGISTFGLPNLLMKVPVSVGTGPGLTPISLAQTGGVGEVIVTGLNLPAHNHTLNAVNTIGTESNPSGMMISNTSTRTAYAQTGINMPMSITSVTPPEQSKEEVTVPIIQPYIAINYIIAITGAFPQPGQLNNI
jgi:microcystin-dependent protein